MEDIGLQLCQLQAPLFMPSRTPSATPSPLHTPSAHQVGNVSAEELHQRLQRLIAPSSNILGDKNTEPNMDDASHSSFGPQQSSFFTLQNSLQSSFGFEHGSPSSSRPQHGSQRSFDPQHGVQSGFGLQHGLQRGFRLQDHAQSGFGPQHSSQSSFASPQDGSDDGFEAGSTISGSFQLEAGTPPMELSAFGAAGRPQQSQQQQQLQQQRAEAESHGASATSGRMQMVVVPMWCMPPWQKADMCASYQDTAPEVAEQEPWDPSWLPRQWSRSSRRAHRAAKRKPQGPLPPPVSHQSFLTSVGSIGHPDGCSGPCRFAHTKKGCRNGAQCTHCHHCVWSDKSSAIEATVDGEATTATTPEMSDGAQASEELAPVGTQVQYQ
eukprot:CAMPEP_0115228152 /NCGR_PEP_ID=MMETSP0270-20121206/31521_1 /TAXON_ID=71861 /ORGANISM="Scrippsiella trochoidea, Strain CCMP3099" /LENGTH=379 /DNA_ID=CAMNT_0002642641 /DNA_START=69 /DNA_END=1208 /DNA_ORIENTATION=+